MNRSASSFFISFVMALTVLCPFGSAENESPAAVVREYFEALQHGDAKKIDTLFSNRVLEEKGGGSLQFAGDLFKDQEFGVEEPAIREQAAIVKVKSLHPLPSFMASTVIDGEDISILYEKPALGDQNQGKDIKVGSKSASIQRQGFARSKVESGFELKLVSESGIWKIDFDKPATELDDNLDLILAMGIRRPEYEDRKYEITLLDGRTYVVDRIHYDELSRNWLMMVDKQEAAYSADKQVRDEVLNEKREAAQKNTRIEYIVHEGLAGDIRNWNRLSKGISEEEVRQILGGPDSEGFELVNGQKHKTWKYPKGQINFLKNKAVEWKAPVARRVRIDPNFKGMDVSEDEIQARIEARISTYRPKAPAPLDDRMRDGILEAKETIKVMSKYLRIPSGSGQK